MYIPEKSTTFVGNQLVDDDAIFESTEGVDESVEEYGPHPQAHKFEDKSDSSLANTTQNVLGSDQTLAEILGEKGSQHFYVSFCEGDARDPMYFSKKKKWSITAMACLFAALAAANGVSYVLGFSSMKPDLDCTQLQAALGISTYCLGFGFVPLFSAPLSEEFGRRPLYIISIIGFSLTHLMIALSNNVQTIIIARLLGGAFGSTGSTMAGGTIADIWNSQERGLPMSILSLTSLGFAGLGAVAGGWIEQNPHLRWRWIQWASLIFSGALSVIIPLWMGETRSSVLLLRLAKKMRKETGDQRYRARIEDELPSLRKMILIPATRPIYFIFTEPIVASFSLWVGFAWGVLYTLVESIGPVFTELYHFNSGEVGSVYVTMVIGSLLGYVTNMYQEKLYRKNVATRGPEARLYITCFTTFLFPIGMFIFAWTAFPFVSWMGPAIGVVLFMWGLFSIYCAGITYLADVYGPFASSAISGQSLSRNLLGAAFPLFTEQMFAKLGYNWSNTLFGLLALAMVPIPTLLFFYGPRIRARSKFASQVVKKHV